MKGRTKTVILVGDGMGDYPIDELDGRTPLEAAHTPAMDFISASGELCLLNTIPPGYAPGSDVANLSLLGYRPQDVYTGRAPLEAASMGVTLRDDDIAFRCNLVTLDHISDHDVTMLDYSAGHISTDESRRLIETLDFELGDALMRFYPGVSYRHLFVQKGTVQGLTTHPPHDYTGQNVTKFWQEYLKTSLGQIISYACDVLSCHDVNLERLEKGLKPANAIWLWGEGRAPKMPTLFAQYGITGALISAVDLLKGIGVYADMDIINVKGATGYLDTNYQGKVDAALEALQHNDLVFVHVEAPDETGHQGLLKEKIQAIEDFDHRIVQPILDGLRRGTDFRIVVAMDHFTPLSIKTHAARSVPVAMYSPAMSKGGSGLAYNEKNGDLSKLVLADGRAFFDWILKGR